MHSLIDRLLADHESMRRLVDWLGRHPSLRAEPLADNVALMVDAMTYLTRFPDVSHHPLEDRIAEHLMARGALDAGLGQELEAQHAQLAAQGRDLLRDLEGALRQESMSPELAVDNARVYAERLRHNMTFEELTLFPAAQRHLGAADWSAIEPVVQDLPPDPLFQPQVEERFAQLQRAITGEAGCDCL